MPFGIHNILLVLAEIVFQIELRVYLRVNLNKIPVLKKIHNHLYKYNGLFLLLVYSYLATQFPLHAKMRVFHPMSSLFLYSIHQTTYRIQVAYFTSISSPSNQSGALVWVSVVLFRHSNLSRPKPS